ncbi:CvpA family protein [Methylomicrobium sp. RS1]|jgi:membrane protein required for colicin V production|uniref:CvpA family protein n=1 Tax=Candidatus Methylomicrobium oryzae TaxID=2802053 RepID=UPI00192296D6|nr:CvpA family protein [Methylomicrobium sp. RS1]MBL1262388.1 CvpA family protein [Methylomicrobium sp. RS1]
MAMVQFMAQFFVKMLWIDYAIVVVLTIFLLIGLLRGAALETRSLTCWLIAAAIGWYFADAYTRAIRSEFPNPKAEIAAAFAILFVLTLTLGTIIFFIQNFKKKRTYPSLFGHFAGLPVALFRGLLFINLIVIFAGLTPLPRENWWHESMLLPHFQNAVVWLKTRFPSGFSDFLRYS